MAANSQRVLGVQSGCWAVFFAFMPHINIFLSVRREFSFRVRLLVVLLAMVQFIAPTWHVCEMGGTNCCPSKTSASKLKCELTGAPGSTPGVVPCAECPLKAEASAPQLFIGEIPAAHTENCLAKLLLGMPWQAVAPEEIGSLRAIQVGSTPKAPRLVTLTDLPQPPSRGPPVFST